MLKLRGILSSCAIVIATGLAPGPASAQNFTDIYIALPEPGWGVNAVQSDSFMFLTFFIYDSSKNPVWYSGEATRDATGNFTGPLYRTNGTYFGSAWNPADHPANTQVGTVSFQPSLSNNYQATLIYTVSGTTVTKSIERLTLTTIALGGMYTGGQSGRYAGCADPTNNVPYVDVYPLQVTHLLDGTVTFDFSYSGNFNCTNSGKLEQHGSLYRVNNATYVCTQNGSTVLNTTATLTDIKSTALGIEGRLFAPNIGSGCSESAVFSAVFN